jgi:hypothetical protein
VSQKCCEYDILSRMYGLKKKRTVEEEEFIWSLVCNMHEKIFCKGTIVKLQYRVK